MKTFILSLFILCCGPLWAAAAQDVGIGVMLGNPTGFNGKYWLNEGQAVDGGLAYSLGKHNELSLHSDFLLHNEAALYFKDEHPLDLYYGIGGRMEFSDDIELGVRIPIGVTHRLDDQSAELFGEIAPIVDFVTRTGIEMHFAVGARYYLK